MVAAFIIWSACALVFLIISVRMWTSKKTVGFFANVEPPKVKDVKKYNHAVAKLFIAYAVIFELLGLPFLFLKQNSAGFLFVMLGVVALTIAMMAVYLLVILRKYQ